MLAQAFLDGLLLGSSLLVPVFLMLTSGLMGTSMSRALFLLWIKTKEALEPFRMKPMDG